MLILVTTFGIFTFLEVAQAREFEGDISEHGSVWPPFFTLLGYGEGAQPC